MSAAKRPREAEPGPALAPAPPSLEPATLVDAIAVAFAVAFARLSGSELAQRGAAEGARSADVGETRTCRTWDLTRYHVASPASRQEPTHFGLEPPAATALLPKSSGLRADRYHVSAHGSGTHSECAAHVLPDWDGLDLSTVGAFAAAAAASGELEDGGAVPVLEPCACLDVEARRLDGAPGESYDGSVPPAAPDELVVCRAALEEAWFAATGAAAAAAERATAVFVRVRRPPRGPAESPESCVFFTVQAVRWLVAERGCLRLLVDQPSLDRLVCGPAMPAHRAFFLASDAGGGREWDRDRPRLRRGALVTELVRVDEAMPPGLYALNLQLAPLLGTDAVPSRVVMVGPL